jgi:hypothetical protein
MCDVDCDDDQVPDLETPYSSLPNRDHSHASESIHTILTERQQQLDAGVHDIESVDKVMDQVYDFHQQLFEKQERIKQSMILHRGLQTCRSSPSSSDVSTVPLVKMMQASEKTTVDPGVIISPDTIRTLQNFLASLRVMVCLFRYTII